MSWLSNLFGGGKPDENKFGAIVDKHLREHGAVQGRLVYDQTEFAIKVVAEDGAVSRSYYLRNAYEDYCRSAPQNRESVLAAYFQAPPEVPDSLHDAITHIMPRLQVRTFFDSILLQSRLGAVPSQDQGFAYRIIANHFAAALIYDTERHVSYVPSQKYAAWGTTFDELFERALVNLDRVTPEPFQRTQEGLYYSHYQDTHDATRILLKARISECRLNGRPVAVMPNRNRLLLAGENDHTAQKAMLDQISQALKDESRPQPVYPIVFDGTNWQFWQTPPENPHAEEFKRIVAMALSEEYSTQKQYLDAINEKEQKDTFVANLMLFQNQHGKVHSVATITEGIASMIPKAEQIAFVKPPDSSAIFPWDEAAALLGQRLSPIDGLWPPRFFVDSFPTEAELQTLRETTAKSPS